MHVQMVVNFRLPWRAASTRVLRRAFATRSPPSSFSFSTAFSSFNDRTQRLSNHKREQQQQQDILSNCYPSSSSPTKDLPLTGLFAVNKPTGITSTTIIDLIQYICQRKEDGRIHPLVKGVLALDDSKRAKRGLVKIGHGGTLDPLARGIVVIGMGSGCKKLHNMSASTKVYIAEARLGVSSDTLDSTGALVAQRPTDHVTQKKLLETLEKFKGEINQVPPLYSALSMDGKRLYDYAREGKPLPREIPSRKVQIYDLELLSFLPHRSSSASSTFEDTQLTSVYGFQPRSLPSLPPPSSASVPSMSSLGLKSGFQAKKHSDSVSNIPQDDDTSLYFHIRVHCSSGTYIRTLIADIATELGTVGHMTDLLRVEQSGFKLGEESTLEFSDCEDVSKINNAIQAGNLVWESQAGSDIKSSEPVSGSKYEMIDRGS